jgi:hypothetical protein
MFPSFKFPWLSALLLLLTYATFGWLLYGWTIERQMWILAALGTLVLGGIVAYPGKSIELGLTSFFGANARGFILIIVTSILSVVLLTWFQFLADIILLLSAGLLFSLDLKVSGWGQGSRLLLIIGWQLLGMSLGLLIHYLVLNPESFSISLSWPAWQKYLPSLR